MALAKADDLLMIGGIAAVNNIPRKFLRCPNIRANSSAARITYGRVPRSGSPSSGEESCEVRRVFDRMAESAREDLDRTTGADSLSSPLLDDNIGEQAGEFASLLPAA